MSQELQKTQLFQWLKKQNADLADRVATIRCELAKWLPQIVGFFPHYPSHGLDHSDRIIAQLSKLLFRRSKPVVSFSSGEVYCLLCATHLHDAGMVVSPREATEILASESWQQFVAEDGQGHNDYRGCEELRADNRIEHEEQRNFLADVALRQLVAEFIRKQHHERGKTTLELHPFLKQLVDHGDSVAFETIGDIGVGHGLRESDLADTSRFPEERDVLGDKVNVRFLARLLRIGDLLDMDSRRADPMTARAVAPLPSSSVPHWQQYSAKKHENVSPERIEFRFECKDQETHRVLRDWFGWLESEVRTAGLEQVHSARHEGWGPPRCWVSSQASAQATDDKPQPTIVIKPAKDANYTFHDWRLELDHERILDRLIYDVYAEPVVFVRELIQNALDATRCQMYADFAVQNPGGELPECPTQFPEEFRKRYPVVVAFAEEEVEVSPDAPSEPRKVFTIEDSGTGMDEHIITKYFLQIGRSYYDTDEFRKQYHFAPTSRFGVGFLSAFAVSRNITVETAHRNMVTGEVEGVRLILREPRNYLLTERWDVPTNSVTGQLRTGTRIRVVLDDWPNDVSLVDLVRRWCVAVEVPIITESEDDEVIVLAKRLRDKTVLRASRVNPAGRFILRMFDLVSPDVEGQIGIIAYQDEKGEGWCDCWPDKRGLDGKRIDELPVLHGSFTALCGINIDRDGGDSAPFPSQRLRTILNEAVEESDYFKILYRRPEAQWLKRADIRTRAMRLGMARSSRASCSPMRESGLKGEVGDSDITDRVAADVASSVVAAHLRDAKRAEGKRGTLYRGRVLSGAPVANEWRDVYPETVVTWQGGRRNDIAVKELLGLEEVTLLLCLGDNPLFGRNAQPPTESHPQDINTTVPLVSWSDIPFFAQKRFQAKLLLMNLHSVQTHGNLWLLTFSAKRESDGFERTPFEMQSWIGELGMSNQSNIQPYGLHIVPFGSPGDVFALDSQAPIVQWLSRLSAASTSEESAICSADVESCWHVALTQSFKMRELMARWAKNQHVPEELRPPTGEQGDLIISPLELIARSTVIDE